MKRAKCSSTENLCYYHSNSNMVCFHIFSLLALFHLFSDVQAATDTTTDTSTDTTAPAATSTVHVDYTQIINARGDRLPDFSYCGYHAQEEALPADDTTPSLVVSSGQGDQSSTIQAALDQVAAAGGGVVKLDSGTFEMTKGLTIQNNTILRG